MFGAIGKFEGEPRFISAKSAGLCCEAEIWERTGVSGGYIRVDRSAGDKPGARLLFYSMVTYVLQQRGECRWASTRIVFEKVTKECKTVFCLR
jgi:hypothetical protein